ncbi:MAG: phage coat protein [Ruminococcus sp.]|nr:phage coat protein [Ruminococcus sp.]MCM1380330.1 hypothetical protein [Muribaculaceae bacterium]MCM1478242.1 hypothetical protein [Muribaculaceae bacterium]
MSIFDSKHFNAEIFGKYLETVPRIKQNAFLKAGILRTRSDLKTMLTEQTGGNYISIPMTGLIGGEALNYDGNTDITATGIDTYLQSMIVVGRAKAWEEKDFSTDITGKDFMADIASQVAGYWDDVDQKMIISILTGIFDMSGNDDFADKHTLRVSGGVVENTLNNAIQQAAGANKNIFTLAIMHSQVATNLENMQLLDYVKGTDANGIQHNMSIANWNGRTVLIDDDVPTKTVNAEYTKSTDTAVSENKAYYTRSGTAGKYTYTRVASPTGDPSASNYYEMTTIGSTEYTTYILGQNAFDYCNCGAKVPNETARDATKAGGIDKLITRQRKLYAPRGISFIQPDTPIISPTNEQLETGSNWGLVKATADNTWYNHKAIPIARIISNG